MRIEFRTNLGIRDASRYSLDHAKCTAGATLDVEDDAAIELVSQGVAVQVEVVKAVPEPAKVHAVPPEEGTVEKATADLEAYRDKQRKPKAKSKSADE